MVFQKLKTYRSFDVEGQQDPSLILKSWLDGDTLKQEGSADIPNSNQTGNNGTKGGEIDVNSVAEDGQTALHVAVRQGHLEIVRVLLENGASLNKPDARGWTPKALAERHAQKDIYDLVLNYENSKNFDGPTEYPTNHYKKPGYVSSSSSTYPICGEAVKSEKKRVTIHMKFPKNTSSQKQLPKLIILPDSLEELLRIAGTNNTF